MNVFRDIPALLLGGVRRLDGRTIAMALDHLVQPLTILCAELLVVLVAAIVWWLTRGGTLSAAAAIVAAAGVGAMAFSLFLAWAAHMRGQIPPKALLGLPRYLVSRARNQGRWLFSRQREWVRTPRAEEGPGGPPDSGGTSGGGAAHQAPTPQSSSKASEAVAAATAARPVPPALANPHSELAAARR